MNICGDFHIHSCLSPCGSLDMSPAAIIEQAQTKGMNALALTDHNTTRNVRVFHTLCQNAGIYSLCGVEVNTIEETHILALFDHPDPAEDLGRILYQALPDIPNKPEVYGDQPVVNEDNEILELIPKALAAPCIISLSRLGELIHERGGLFIPSHVERPYTGVIDRLGFIPNEPFDAVEVSRRTPTDQRAALAGNYPWITNSDAHHIDDIAAAFNQFELDTFSIESLRNALTERRNTVSP